MKALLVLLALAVAPVQAHATPIVGPPQYQRWVDGAQVRTPESVVFVLPTGCGVDPACAAPGLIRFDPTLNLGKPPRSMVRAYFLHEVGHLRSYELTTQQVGRFLRLVHTRRPWRSPPNSPHEWYAELYSACARGLKREPTEIGYNTPDLTVRQYRRVCAFMRR